jgi:hypothetical protein
MPEPWNPERRAPEQSEEELALTADSDVVALER